MGANHMAEQLRGWSPGQAVTPGECSPGCVPACGCVHDSPDFVPDAQRALEARGLERVNRHAPSPPPDAGAKCACGRWPVGVPCPVCTDDGPDGGGLPPAPEATGEMSDETLHEWLCNAISESQFEEASYWRPRIVAEFAALRASREAERKSAELWSKAADASTRERDEHARVRYEQRDMLVRQADRFAAVELERDEARRMIAGVQPDDRAALAVNILRAWPRAEIETFARHLLGDREQESLLLGQLQTQLEIVTRERDEAREQRGPRGGEVSGTRWEVTYRRVQWWEPNGVPQLEEVNRLGAEGWEPFAATDTRDGMTVFLRRAARAEVKEE